MCGIAGIVKRAGITERDLALVRDINARLRHRGPDGAGEYHDHHVALAMRRLSIIDLAHGWQPLYNEDRSLALIANGEIYNFVELRAQLEKKGHRFATGSDCETILHLYEDHGRGCVDHLRGMFAFALWDVRAKRLLLARDRMGEKPLYLVERGGEIIFASELKALLGSGAVSFELDPDAVHRYFHYWYVPEPQTAIVGVRKLPAAHTLTIDVESWRIDERCYWRMEDAPPLEGDPAQAIRAQLERISEIIVRSDVPVGVALSGGLDSSAIATLAAKTYPGKIHAVSVGYSGRPWQDERGDAAALARHLDIPFHDLELSTEEMIASLPQMVADRDDPVADISAASFYFVMRQARACGVPVMLAGNGGDELFWGYGWVREAVRASRRKDLLRSGDGVGLRDYLLLRRPPLSYTGSMRWLRAGGGLLSGVRHYQRDRRAPAERLVFYDISPGWEEVQRRIHGVYTQHFADKLNGCDPAREFTLPRPWPPLPTTMTRLICETYLREMGLAVGDRLSMAHSVELRLPLVDYQLVETVIGLRKTQDDLKLPAKHWLREAVRGVVPDFVLQRRKRGFTPPWRQWARALARRYADQVPGGYLVEAGILKPDAAQQLSARLAPHPLGVADFLADHAMMLEMWCRNMNSQFVQA